MASADDSEVLTGLPKYHGVRLFSHNVCYFWKRSFTNGMILPFEGFPHSSSLDVIPSKEADHGKSAELSNFDDLGRSSLGDVFSPVRDGKLLILEFVKHHSSACSVTKCHL